MNVPVEIVQVTRSNNPVSESIHDCGCIDDNDVGSHRSHVEMPESAQRGRLKGRKIAEIFADEIERRDLLAAAPIIEESEPSEVVI